MPLGCAGEYVPSLRRATLTTASAMDHDAETALTDAQWASIRGDNAKALEILRAAGRVQARVETSGNVFITQRPTLTRMALGAALPGTALIPGLAFQKKKKHDHRQLYLIVEHPEWSIVESLDPRHETAARTIV